MGFRSKNLLLVVAVLTPEFRLAAQGKPPGNNEERALERLAIQSRLKSALDRDYNEQPADELLTLAIQHTDIAIPEIKRRLSTYSQQSRKKLDKNPAIHADALAYV